MPRPKQPSKSTLKFRALRATPVEVPLNFVLGTSQQALLQVPLLLIDLDTEEGVTGRAYLFCYLRAAVPGIMSLLSEIERLVQGDPLDPKALWAKLTPRFMLIGLQGIVRMALAGFDVACWDALAIAAGEPLVRLLGAETKPIPAYNSCGLGLTNDLGALGNEAEKLLAGGFKAIKLRLGYPTFAADIAAIRAVRNRIGENVALMVDYNQALSLNEALLRGRALDAEGIYWFEEPIRHDDYAGCAQLASELKVPVQIGENFSLPSAMKSALAQGAADYVMPDLERIGGITGWQCAAIIAAENGMPMSSHLFPEVSAHLLAATPTCHYLEYVDWANVLLREPLKIQDGSAIISEKPGNGIVWDESAVKHYRLE
jgi:mandelate racemase